jgi:hypothetical protein
VVFVGKETASTGRSGGESVHSHFSAHRLSDGVSLWPAPARIKGGLNDVIFLDGGLVVGPRTEGRGAITMLDYATGQSRWGRNGKGITIRGGIVDHDMTDAGLLLVTGYDSAWTDKGTEYGLNVLDTASGSLRFKKPVRLMGRIVSTEVTPRGILYVTTSEVNILDPRTGEPRLREPIVSKDSLITARYGHQLYVFSQDAGALYRIDTYQGVAHRLSTTTVRLEEDAAPMALEIGRDTITVVSNQNIIVFNPDGSLKLRAHHPAPRHPALVRALLRARSLGAGMAAFASGVSGGAFGTASRNRPEGSPDRVITAGLAQGYADMAEDYASLSGAYAAAARARFGASATSRDFVFMMVSYTRSGYALAKVSKKSGEVLEVINLGHDKEPIYEVDSLAGRIYYRPTPTRIDGYRF